MTALPISAAGIHTVPDDLMIEALVDRARRLERSPCEAVAELAEHAMRARGHSLRDIDVRLNALTPAVDPGPQLADGVAAGVVASLLGPLYERLIDRGHRRRAGTHLTPVDVARRLIGCLSPTWTASDDLRVLDPTVGGGAFLLAAADGLVAAGHPPAGAHAALLGVDVDPAAVAVAEVALALWLLDHGLAPSPAPGLVVGDALHAPLPAADVVVGNPPFLNQLRRSSAGGPERRASLRTRWGTLVGAYTDEAWLFLAAALEAVGDDGQVMLVQPTSILAARDAAVVRQRVHDVGRLVGIWVAGEPVFDASVDVCALVVEVGSDSASHRRTGSTSRWVGRDVSEAASATVDGPANWGRAAAPLTGVPSVHLDRSSGTIGDLASATAGFRDQFYGFVDHVGDGPGRGAAPRLVTVGMVDPFELRWGSDRFRYAKRVVVSPYLDLVSLAKHDEPLARWAEDRLRPKVLVATQTRIIEAWPDLDGDTVPVTPMISLEPTDPADVVALTAALAAPPIVADLAAANFGTALSDRALKIAARNLAAVPLPTDRGAWRDATTLIEQLLTSAPVALSDRVELGRCLSRAHGVVDDDLLAWWLSRWPKRRNPAG